MTNKLEAIKIKKQNLYTYNEFNKLSESNIKCGALSFYMFRKSIKVQVNMRKRLKAIEGN